MSDALTIALVLGGVGTVGGIGCLVKARTRDAQNYILQRATPLPLAMVNVRDDVWVTGDAVCESPLVAPHFGTRCLYYHYRLEERVTEHYRDSKGRSRTRQKWVTRQTEDDAANFLLQDGDRVIAIKGSEADFRDLPDETVREGSWRHNLTFYPYPCTINAVGSVSEEKIRLEPYDNIPLMITTKTRGAFLKAAEAAERWLRGGGFIAVWLGMTALFCVLFNLKLNTAAGEFSMPALGFACIPSSLILMVYWAIYQYNSLITYRQRCNNAWRQVDVDLRMRYDLIPRLVATVKGYMAHEAGLFEDVTALRSQALEGGRDTQISAEEKLAGEIGQLMVRIEDYPDLKAQPLVERLMRELRAVEEKIAHGRSVYSETVMEYNNAVATLPTAFIARPFGFQTRLYFEAQARERQAPAVAAGHDSLPAPSSEASPKARILT